MSVNPVSRASLRNSVTARRERRVIVFERQDVICPLLGNGLRDLFLTPHRINRDDRPFEVQQMEELGNGG